MSIVKDEPAPIGSEAIKWRLFLLAVIGPLTGLSIGVDGGDIFQILAAQTLELDPRAVGAALLFGALSIPVQIWAARIPLTRARYNIRLFLWLLGSLALITSVLVVAAPPGTWIAGLVLVVAVIAEIGISVLFATAWQPLISYTLSTEQRQFMNGRARAATGVALLGGAILFGQLGQTGRALFLATLGLTAIVVGWSLRILPPPPAHSSEPESNDAADAAHSDDHDGGSLTNVFIAMPAIAFASWPLLVSYGAATMWPDGNLGLLAGSIALGSVVTSAAWRDPGRHLIKLIRVAAGVLAACSLTIVALDSPIGSNAGVVILLSAVTTGSASRTAMSTAVMELAHRRITPTNAVRVMTMMDVVGSTSFQVGAFLAGFLIASSTNVSGPIDPYQIWLVATAVALLLTTARFRSAARTSIDA